MAFGKLEDVVKAGASRLGSAVRAKVDGLEKFERNHQTVVKVTNLSLSGLVTASNAVAGGFGGYLAVQEALRFSPGVSSGPEFYGTVGLWVAVEGLCLLAASSLGRGFYKEWKSYFPGKTAAGAENSRAVNNQR